MRGLFFALRWRHAIGARICGSLHTFQANYTVGLCNYYVPEWPDFTWCAYDTEDVKAPWPGLLPSV